MAKIEPPPAHYLMDTRLSDGWLIKAPALTLEQTERTLAQTGSDASMCMQGNGHFASDCLYTLCRWLKA
jgi:hypothetical protein